MNIKSSFLKNCKIYIKGIDPHTVMHTKMFLLKLATVIWGVVFGLFAGFLLIGTILRVIFDFIFHWGDSGPEWVGWLIFLITAITIVVSCYVFLGWTNSYLKRKGFFETK